MNYSLVLEQEHICAKMLFYSFIFHWTMWGLLYTYILYYIAIRQNVNPTLNRPEHDMQYNIHRAMMGQMQADRLNV